MSGGTGIGTMTHKLVLLLIAPPRASPRSRWPGQGRQSQHTQKKRSSHCRSLHRQRQSVHPVARRWPAISCSFPARLQLWRQEVPQPSSRCNRCPRLEVARLATTAPAATASAVRVTTVRPFKKSAKDARWGGIHQAGTASRAGEIRPSGSPMLQVLLSGRAPK